MPAPRILQAFIPFQVLMRTFDKGRSPLERTLYGVLSLAFVAALIGGIMRATSGDSAATEMINYGLVWLFGLIKLCFLVVVAVFFVRRGMAVGSTNRLKSISFYILGVTSGIAAVALFIALGYISTQY